MKTLIVYVSISNGNTKRVAQAIAEVLDAKLLEPEEVDVSTLADYDLIGFGAGVYYSRLYKRLRNFIKGLPSPVKSKKVFLFATIGHGKPPTKPMERLLTQKGWDIVGVFSCLGYDKFLLARLFGFQNKGRPNSEDLQQARDFARSLKDNYQVA